ncbi:iron-containing alcohol dehydrogenase [Gottschalkiaceae bacterium SANA]|nr:iron-containing alcohol dehydrogenase [Gottschalkiaceae bacterium SANA]
MTHFFTLPTKIHLEKGALDDLPALVKTYGNRVFLVTTANRQPLADLYARIKTQLTEIDCTVYHFDKVQPNPPVDIIEMGIQELQAFKPDLVLSVGGGSSIDTAKTVALLHDQTNIDWAELFDQFGDPHGQYPPVAKKRMPHIAVPTTAGTGSEVTQAAVLSMGHDKLTIYHPQNRSDHAILDPMLTLTLPAKLTATTGFDAFTHAFESYIHPKATPLGKRMSFSAMELIVDALPKLAKHPNDLDLRQKLMEAQVLAGIGLSNAGADAPHPLSEIIGGISGIPHGESLALIYPEFIHYKWKYAQADFAAVARLFDPSLQTESMAARALAVHIKLFIRKIGLPKGFSAYTIPKSQWEEIVNSPILGFLPFGSKEDLTDILIQAKER